MQTYLNPQKKYFIFQGFTLAFCCKNQFHVSELRFSKIKIQFSLITKFLIGKLQLKTNMAEFEP